MSFFNPEIPVISRKKPALEAPAAPGVWLIHFQLGSSTLFASFYTKHDQACLLWGIISGGIFVVAQFFPISWITQAIFASALTLIGVLGMVYLTWHLTVVDRLTWILFSWVFLMLIGAIVTDLSIFFSWSNVLMRICPLWLGLSAIGYLITGVGMRSRAFFLLGLLHLLAIGMLPYVGIWQQLVTGLIIGGSVFLVAELQWDSNGVCNYQAQQQVIQASSEENYDVSVQSIG
ncbi:MAG TPA: hypothetical protein V6D10_14115 [Trichocoleus sp.]|jgi:hypothetical protein